MSLSIEPETRHVFEPPTVHDERLAREFLGALQGDEPMDDFGPATAGAMHRLVADWLRRADQSRSGAWGILEVLGHVTLAGKIREVEQLGVRWVEIEIPALPVPASFEEQYDTYYMVPAHEAPPFSRLFRPTALYGMRWTTEADAREQAARLSRYDRPPYELPSRIAQPEPMPGHFVCDDDGGRHLVVRPPSDPAPAAWKVWVEGRDGQGAPTLQYLHRARLVAVLDAQGALLWGISGGAASDTDHDHDDHRDEIVF